MMDHVKAEVVRDAENGRGGALTASVPQQAVSRPGQKPRARRWVIAGVALAAAGGVAAWGIWERQSAVDDLGKTAAAASVPKVALVSPQHGPASRSLTMPGQTQAWYQAPIYAQVTGYVTKWDKDYGAAVKKGDVLATIETPDLDQKLQQARAELDVAKSKAALTRVTAQRWQKLAGTQAVSQEAVDVNVADARSAQAAVQAAQFNVARFEAQEAFKQVVSPFDGVVTSRSTDIGAFVNAAGGTAQQKGGTQELFTVADVHEIRVFVSVPQDYSASIKPGLTASITLPQFPGRVFKANFITSAKSFDSNARTVLTELTIPNPDGEIWPGAYADVRFEVPTDPRILIIPEQSLLFRAQGLQVALVGPGNKVHLQDIKIGLNLGGTVQVVDGLKPSDRLIDNPSDGLLEGQQVDVVQTPAQPSGDASIASNSAASRPVTGPGPAQ